MTLAERKTNPAITTMLAEALTESEMEQTVGGVTHPVDGVIMFFSWVACGFHHNYKYTGKKQTGSLFGRWWPNRERVCTRCGKKEWVW